MWNALVSIIGESWNEVGRQVAQVLPNLLAAFLLFAFGVLAGVVVGRVARWTLVAARVDRAATRLGVAEPLAQLGIMSVARLVATTLKWTVIAAAFIPALYTLDPRVASDLASRALLYLPHLVVAVVLLWIGTVLSRFLSRGVLIAAVNNQMVSPRLLAAATRTAILLVTIAIVLDHVGIGRTVVLTAFAVLFGGVVLAAALAVGLGSKDIVHEWLHARLTGGDQQRQEEPFQHW
jgi:hypothetical protein